MLWLDLFAYPFMQRAMIAGIVLGALLAYVGIFAVMRRISFFGDGVAHASLAGIAIGLVAGWQPLLTAIIFSIVLATIMYWLERRTNVASDALLGILFTTSMALGVILISRQPGYQPELVSYLFGNILSISWTDVLVAIIFTVIILSVMVWQRRAYTLLALHHELAVLSGTRVQLLHLMYYIMLAVTVVLGVKMFGVVLVSALLITPVSIAKQWCGSFQALSWWTLVIAELLIIVGLTMSYYFDIPSGPLVVVLGAVTFLGSVVGARWRRR